MRDIKGFLTWIAASLLAVLAVFATQSFAGNGSERGIVEATLQHRQCGQIQLYQQEPGKIHPANIPVYMDDYALYFLNRVPGKVTSGILSSVMTGEEECEYAALWKAVTHLSRQEKDAMKRELRRSIVWIAEENDDPAETICFANAYGKWLERVPYKKSLLSCLQKASRVASN
jgi:hypothetical protein